MEENIKNNSPTVRYTLYAQCEIICNTVCLTKKCLIFGERKKTEKYKIRLQKYLHYDIWVSGKYSLSFLSHKNE